MVARDGDRTAAGLFRAGGSDIYEFCPPGPSGYAELLQDLSVAGVPQVRAALAVNRELVLLYWSIGRDILQRQNAERDEVRRSSIGWPMTCRMNFRAWKAPAPEVSNTCVPWLRPGRRNQLCNSLLHNCPGSQCASSGQSKGPPYAGSGISGRRSSTAGVKMSSFT
jgi:hypothetical protein